MMRITEQLTDELAGVGCCCCCCEAVVGVVVLDDSALETDVDIGT